MDYFVFDKSYALTGVIVAFVLILDVVLALIMHFVTRKMISRLGKKVFV